MHKKQLEYLYSEGINEIQKCLTFIVKFRQINLIKNKLITISLDEGETIDENKINQ